MTPKIIIFTLFVYSAVLLQLSFLPHFKIFNFGPNLVLLVVLLVNLFEDSKSRAGLWTAFLGGFLLDIFSPGLIGFYTLILFASAFLIKLILRRYVWSPII
ncbi:MAG: rod shape-determining protein MreD [Candidatus Nealsonbacteria bacterium]